MFFSPKRRIGCLRRVHNIVPDTEIDLELLLVPVCDLGYVCCALLPGWHYGPDSVDERDVEAQPGNILFFLPSSHLDHRNLSFPDASRTVFNIRRLRIS